MLKLRMSMVAGLCWLAGAYSALAAQSPEEIVAGFDKRVEAMFRAESGKPLVRADKKPPLDPGRGNYVRAYSYSMVGFAARCLYLNEMLDEANAALAENAQHYLDNPKDINDRDSFHWHADVVMRLVEMYGSKGIKHPGRITKETEALVLKPIWEYVKLVKGDITGIQKGESDGEEKVQRPQFCRFDFRYGQGDRQDHADAQGCRCGRGYDGDLYERQWQYFRLELSAAKLQVESL